MPITTQLECFKASYTELADAYDEQLAKHPNQVKMNYQNTYDKHVGILDGLLGAEDLTQSPKTVPLGLKFVE